MTPDLKRAVCEAVKASYIPEGMPPPELTAWLTVVAALRALENLSLGVVEAMVDAARGNEKRFDATKTSVVLAAHRAMIRAVIGEAP